MTDSGEDEGNSPQTSGTGTRLISVLDAVCCVYFCAAGKCTLLISILTHLGLEILIPGALLAGPASQLGYDGLFIGANKVAIGGTTYAGSISALDPATGTPACGPTAPAADLPARRPRGLTRTVSAAG